MKNTEILTILNSYYVTKKNDISLPAAVAWKRRLNMRDLESASKVINEAITELDAKYEDDEHSEVREVDGKEMRIVRSEFIVEYTKAKAEILSQDTDVTVRKIKIGDLEGISLSDEILDTLEFMIEE